MKLWAGSVTSLRHTARVQIAVYLLSLALLAAVLSIAVLTRRLRQQERLGAQAGLPMSTEVAVRPGDGVETLARQDMDADGPDGIWRTLLLATPQGQASRLSIMEWPSGTPVPTGSRIGAAGPLARGLQAVINSPQGRGIAKLAADRGTPLRFVFEASPELMAGNRAGTLELVPRVGGGFRWVGA